MAGNNGKVKQIILIRKDLQMKDGKLATQVSHASLGSLLSLKKEDHERYFFDKQPFLVEWLEDRFTKICLAVRNEEELLKYYKIIKKTDIPHALIEDAGFTEFTEPTLTCLGIGPFWNEEIDKITKRLRLY
jgi:PTH2 family peptidyl-tRNA hydrolase